MERWLCSRFRARVVGAPIRLALWDGSCVDLSSQPPIATVRVRNRRTLVELLWDPESHFGEAYARGDIEVDGDLERGLEAVFRHWKDDSWTHSRATGGG